MKRVASALAALLLLAVPAAGQTTITQGPVTTANAWEVIAPANIVTAAEAQTYEFRIKRDGQALTALVNPQCALRDAAYPWVEARGKITCAAKLTQSNVDALNIVGTYNLTATLFRADVGETAPTVTPFVYRSLPGAPLGIRISQ